jgi:hypothetical protein
MALQSITRNGASLRALAAWMDSAARSLPVPVSPCRSTVASEGATLASTAKVARMAPDTPTSEPNARCGATGSRLESLATTRRSSLRPRRRIAPGRSHASSTEVPSTNVPFDEPRSRTRMPFGSTVTSAWKRDTVGSSRTTSFEACAPRAQRSPVEVNVRPAKAPPFAPPTSWKRRTARSSPSSRASTSVAAGAPTSSETSISSSAMVDPVL